MRFWVLDFFCVWCFGLVVLFLGLRFGFGEGRLNNFGVLGIFFGCKAKGVSFLMLFT